MATNCIVLLLSYEDKKSYVKHIELFTPFFECRIYATFMFFRIWLKNLETVSEILNIPLQFELSFLNLPKKIF